MKNRNPKEEIHAILSGARVGRKFREYVEREGKAAVMAALDAWLGDTPGGESIRKAAIALDLPEADLMADSESNDAPTRRVARLILLESRTGVTEDARLFAGLSDASARVRADAARFAGTGEDRTRLYNRLIRFIREDPDARVRRAAGKRLAESFADLYTVDFDGLPALSRMLILDALEGHNRLDEERAEQLLFAPDAETAYRAARCLSRWGALGRRFVSGGEGARPILEKAADLGVADYLTAVAVSDSRMSFAVEIAGRAGRDDIVRSLGPTRSSGERILEGTVDVTEASRLVRRIAASKPDERDSLIEKLPLDSRDFRTAVERAFEFPVNDVLAAALYDIARSGHWESWADRARESITADDPDVRIAASRALAALASGNAAADLELLLHDAVPRVRNTSARMLASIPSGSGGPAIAAFLRENPSEPSREDVLNGLRESGGAALARFIVDNADFLDDKAIGDLLADGIDPLGVELLADEFTRAADLGSALKCAGPRAGASLLAAWPNTGATVHKRLLSWIRSSGWPAEAERIARGHDRPGYAALADAVAPLGPEERRMLLESILNGTDGRSRRRIRRLMKG